jgi:prenyltransferase beta subunit
MFKLGKQIIVIAFICSILFASYPLKIHASEEEEIKKSLTLLRAAAKGHIEKKSCFGCHNQAFPMLAFSKANKRRFEIPKEEIKEQADFTLEFLKKNQEKYSEGKGTGGEADTAGYALLTLELAGVKPNETTDAVVKYFLKHQAANGYWKVTSNRPPSEASHFTTNYLALGALRVWGSPKLKNEIEERTKKSAAWIFDTAPKTNEDQVFQLLAFSELKADKTIIEKSAKALIAKQKADGGWAQLEGMDSDPYATATALVSLHLTEMLSNKDKTFQDGIKYLIKTRKEDGSWFVKSRSKPFQTYYESGFPHGKDQFISVAASGWATTALLLSLGE